MDDSQIVPGAPASDFAITGVRPLPDQIAEAIVVMIASGQLQSGQRIVEAELAERLNTSRVPVREAMRRLEAQGILATVPYRGTRVGAFGEREQAQAAEARIALEGLIFRQAARALRAAPSRVADLDQVLADMQCCVAANNRLALNRADLAFHHAMCRLTGNPILVTLWQAIAPHVLIAFGLSNARYPNSQAVLDQHIRLRAALLNAPLDDLPGLAERHVNGADLVAPASVGEQHTALTESHDGMN
jgi:DNA-binding GntR family transcriptional regulator